MPHTLDEIAVVFGLTRERIRQIEARSLRLLSRNKDIRDFADREITITDKDYDNGYMYRSLRR